MIGDLLTFLRRYLDDRLKVDLGGGVEDPMGDKVVFLDGHRADAATFKQDAVTLLLFNVEEERLLRAPDPYTRRIAEDRVLKVQPDLRLILSLLFVARFRQYDSAWRHLSSVVEHLHRVRTFDAQTTPGLPPSIERLSFELIALDLAQLGQVWSSLRTSQQPSLLYRASLIALRDSQPVEVPMPKTVGIRSTRKQ